MSRIGLFSSKADKLLAQHFDRMGVDRVWHRVLKDAVQACEAGDYFEPLFTAAGPQAARTLVALYKLETFVGKHE